MSTALLGSWWLSRLNIRRLVWAQVMISQLVRLSPTLGSALRAQSLLGILSFPLSLALPCSCSLSLSRSLSLLNKLKKKKKRKGSERGSGLWVAWGVACQDWEVLVGPPLVLSFPDEMKSRWHGRAGDNS